MISRKNFLRRGLASLAEVLVEPSALLDGGPSVAVPRNEHCLAQRGGCFSCLECCPVEAIGIELGKGVKVDRDRCTGCGACVSICPVQPKALFLQPAPPPAPSPSG